MTEKKEVLYTVESLPLSRWSESHFETLAAAENFARGRAFSAGSDYGIFKLVAKAERPVLVNDVKITAV